jgi:hypothetical protein
VHVTRATAAAVAGTTAAPLVPWSVHDLRRTVATGLQRLGVRLEVTEAVLNHISGSRGGIAGVYQRHDWACCALKPRYPFVYPLVYTAVMATKDVGLRVRVERGLRDDFLEACRLLDRPASQVAREFMRSYVDEHGVEDRSARLRG